MSKEERGWDKTGERGTEVDGAGKTEPGFGSAIELDLSEVGVASSAATLVWLWP